LCTDFRVKDKGNIIHLLRSEGFEGVVEFIDYDAEAIFGNLRSLHGDWTAYGRLLIADYIKSDSALYLDSDLVVLLDVLILKNFEFKGATLAAAFGCVISLALDQSFFINHLKWSPSESYFNSGVILFNLKKWREANIEAKWRELADKYPDDLISHDQTLLNAVCEGHFARLSANFNTPWYPGEEKPDDADKSIIHFVGSPKPWDIFGGRLHKGTEIFKIYNSDTWAMEYGKLTAEKIGRTWKIKKSIFRHLKKKCTPTKFMTQILWVGNP
jgi:lipopolysaccharide biosynthesis glycosyltransferase